MKKFPFVRQPDQNNCGATCLQMISEYYGKSLSILQFQKLTGTGRSGTSLANVAAAAESVGFKTLGVRISFIELVRNAPMPCIAHWNNNHFIVVYKVTRNNVWVADPAYGLIKYDIKEFLSGWIGSNSTVDTESGITLLLEPSVHFSDESDNEEEGGTRLGFNFLIKYFTRYKRFLYQLCVGLLASTMLQLIFPFLTQSIVDIGITNKDIGFIYLVLFAQSILFIGRMMIEFIRGWTMLYLSTKINVSLVSDFFIKLMNLPIAYFDSKMTGDIMQRIGDHNRIQNLLTSSSLSAIFSMLNLLLFSAVLLWYNLEIFLIFITGSVFYLAWTILFLNKREQIDYKQFHQSSLEQSKVLELINGMQAIKLNNAERLKRWQWEAIQVKLFYLSKNRLSLEQWQLMGSSFINELKNILISVYSAKLVIEGDITLGMMLSISYISGQLIGPVQQLITFIYSVQDAKISLDRLSQIHNLENEVLNTTNFIVEISPNATIKLVDLRFKYAGSESEVIKGLNFNFLSNKVTAIVGASGSGKTTLMKLLLQFYHPTSGEIKINDCSLLNLLPNVWRSNTGIVMQEGFIFNDTIANNIIIGEDIVDHQKLKYSIEIANIHEFIDKLPQGLNTKIGPEGVGISTGQQQRILIARAVYKNPKFLFFDEATSALDATTEKVVMENLQGFFQNRTVIIIAHRLSTVKNADQIIVLNDGQIVECGTHNELVENKSAYYELVKNQLELVSN